MNSRSVAGAMQVLAVLMLCSPSQVSAQTPVRDAKLIVTVTDPNGGLISGAAVTVTGVDDATKSLVLKPVATSDRGTATLEGLAPGRYSIRAEFAGLEANILKDVRVRSGDNKHVVVLALKKVEESVTVSTDAQLAASDPRRGFRTILTREEINALSDDPAEMAQQLLDMAGGSATFRIDGFSGGPLPPKAMIKSIHIVRDTFAAENHSAESEEIDIITQPGIGPLRGGGTSRYRDGSMSGRSPFTPKKGPERNQNYSGNLGGTLVKDKSSFSINLGRGVAFDTPIIHAALPDGTVSEILSLRRPNDSWSAYGLVDYALTRDHTLRMSYDASHQARRNLGVGAYDLTERAYGSTSRDGELRIQENGPIGRRTFLNTRLQIAWADSSSQATVEAPTLRVTDAFTSGGAQVKGGSHPREFEFASDIDYIRGMHSVRSGVLAEGGHYRTDDASNYFGTFSFTSLDAFKAGQPALFTRRIGNSLVEYWNIRAGLYLQDDLRISRSLTLSPGLRYEKQTVIGGLDGVGPRFGLTWAPFKSGRTSLRASYGLFYGWLSGGTYEQTLRLDGFRQRELNIVNPTYPDPGSAGTTSATNRYVLGDVRFVRTIRFSAGIDQQLTKKMRVTATFSDASGTGLLHGVNLNAPVNGVRPDPNFVNVFETVAEGESRTRQLATTFTLNLAAGSRAAQQGRLNWRRETIRLSYWLAKADNNVEGAFGVSPSGGLATEHAATSGDRRHRVSLSISSQALKNFNATLSLAGNTGTPYTITTGLDNNGDSIFNDRPTGVGRNTVRAPGQYTWALNASYGMALGGASAASSGTGTAQPGRYKLTFTVNATNLSNHGNLSGFSGVMTSPFFQRATAVSSLRQINLSMGLSF